MEKRATPLRFVRLPTGCFVPVSHKLNQDGYFRKVWKDQNTGTRVAEMFHRFIWRAKGNSIPEGWEIDHLCSNRACCNPEHLQCITRKEHLENTNMERYELRKKAAMDYWEKFKCTGTELGERFSVSFSSACRWIRDRKRRHLLIHPVCPA